MIAKERSKPAAKNRGFEPTPAAIAVIQKVKRIVYIATRKISDEDRIEIATLAAEVFGFAYGDAYKNKRQLAEYIAEVFEPDSFISELRADCVECLMGRSMVNRRVY